MNANNPVFFEKEAIPSLLVKFMIPSVIGLCVHSVNNVVDRIFVGHSVGYLGICGIAFSFPILIILFSLGLFLAIGTCSLLSIKLGEKKNKIAEKIFNNGVYFGVILSFFAAFLGFFFTDDLMRLAKVNAEIEPFANDYAFVMFVGAPSYILSLIFSFAIIAEGRPKTAMFINVLCAITNVTLTYLFVMKYNFGVKGSAIATVLSEIIAVLVSVAYYFSNKNVLKIKILNISYKIIYRICFLGFPSFIKFAFVSFQILFLNFFLIKYSGSSAVAAMGIILVISNLSYMILGGITDAMRPIVSYNYGALKFDRTKEAFYYSQFICIVAFIIAYGLVLLFPYEIVKMFVLENDELMNITKIGLILFLPGVLFDSIYSVAVLFLQAIDKAKMALIFTILRQLLIYAPCLFLMPKYFGLNGIWLVGALSGIISIIIATPLFIKEFKALK